jgi:hypothetical protein
MSDLMEIGKVKFLNVWQFSNKASSDDNLIIKVARIIKAIILASYNLLVNVLFSLNNFSITKEFSKSFFQEHKSTINKILIIAYVLGVCYCLDVFEILKNDLKKDDFQNKFFEIMSRSEEIDYKIGHFKEVLLRDQSSLNQIFMYYESDLKYVIIPNDFQKIFSLIEKFEYLKDKTKILKVVKEFIELVTKECKLEYEFNDIPYRKDGYDLELYNRNGSPFYESLNKATVCSIIDLYKSNFKIVDLLFIMERYDNFELIPDIIKNYVNDELTASSVLKYLESAPLDEKNKTNIVNYLNKKFNLTKAVNN